MHFFNIATNLTSGPFIIGYEEDTKNFYLRGETVKDGPQISCRIFDSEGCFLFSMDRNRLSPEAEEKFRIKSEANRLVMIDKKGHTLLKIETRDEAGRQVTYIEGKFFDKNGRLAARGDERGLLVNCPLRM
jgi:uncharacterized protein YxjI